MFGKKKRKPIAPEPEEIEAPTTDIKAVQQTPTNEKKKEQPAPSPAPAPPPKEEIDPKDVPKPPPEMRVFHMEYSREEVEHRIIDLERSEDLALFIRVQKGQREYQELMELRRLTEEE